MSTPGPADSLRQARLDEVLAGYLQRLDRGEPVDRERFLAEHADLADELRSYFEGSDEVRRLADSSHPGAADQTAGWPGHAGQVPPATGSGEAATLDWGPGTTAAPPVGARVRYIGDYELLEELGRGGMGVVYKAQQTKLRRLVALKMILGVEYAGPQELARFRSEAQAVARLQHPNIVQIFAVGEHDGHPYFSLEFCAGGSLEKKLHGPPLPPQEAAALLETLARAMHAAHQAGVIHRDLKPANVLLTAEGTPKITDFGLAKKLAGDLGVDTPGLTASGAIMGTPSYMAPEQAGGKSKQIGPAADVYALGAILYEMLTGRPPFKAATALDTVLQVVSDEPVPPSRLQTRLPRDLETICLRCLEKDPRKRYADAAALAEDLRRFRIGEPILARPTPVWEKAGKWAKRRPALAGLLAVSAAAAFSLLVGGLYFARQLRIQRDFALGQEGIARQEKDEADKQRQRALKGEAEAEAELDRARRRLMTTQLFRVAAVMERDPGQGLDLLNDTKACPVDLRDFSWGFSYRLCKRDRFTLVDHTRQVTSVAFIADGKALVSGSEDSTIKLWDVATGKERRTFRGHTGGVFSVALTPDGQTLASGSGDTTVKLWDVATGKELRTLRGHTGRVTSVAFTPDGQTLASGSGDTTVKLWDVAAGKERTTLKGHTDWVNGVAFTADGKILASGGGDQDHRVKLWDVATGKELRTLSGHKGGVNCVAFSRDAKTLASGSIGDRTVKLWDVATGQERASLRGQGFMPITSVAFTADGQTLASGGAEIVRDNPIGTVKLWDMATGQERASLRGGGAWINSVAFAPDDKTLTSGSWEGGGDQVVGVVKLWDVAMGQERAFLRGHINSVTSVAFSPDGKTLTSASMDMVKLWDVATCREPASLRHDGNVTSVAFTADGQRLASGSFVLVRDKYIGLVKLWDVATCRERATLQGHTDGVFGVAFTPDGKTLASGSADRTIKLWDVQTGKNTATLQGDTGEVYSVGFTADGQTLAAGYSHGQIILWDVATCRERASLKGHTREVSSVTFTPDGQTLASASGDRTVKLWDVATCRERASLRETAGRVAFTPDGKTLAAGSMDQTVKLWDVATGQERASLRGPPSVTTSVAFSPDGKTLAAGSSQFSEGGKPVAVVTLWEAAFPPEIPSPAGES